MKIGIIGGGQLALMMVQSSPEHTYFIVDPNPRCSVHALPNVHLMCCAYGDEKAITWLNKQCDFITYEFENVPSSKLDVFGSKLNPNAQALTVSQNRLREKKMATSLGIKTPKYFVINNLDDLKNALVSIGQRGILKTQEGGYDGKGQVKIIDGKISDEARNLITQTSCILEEFINYEYETSVIMTRDIFGNIIFYPSTINIHTSGILQQTSPLMSINIEKAQTTAATIINYLNIIGTLCVEFFGMAGDFIFNEIAPRVHNTGHWTIEGTNVSQFKNHLYAITGQKVVKPYCKGTSIMINLIGTQYEKAQLLNLPPFANFHSYFKDKVVPGRKMGHITIQNENWELAKKVAKSIAKEIA